MVEGDEPTYEFKVCPIEHDSMTRLCEEVCHFVDDSELGGSLSSHDDHSFVWHGKCVVLA